MKRFFLQFLLTLLIPVTLQAGEIQTREISYQAGSVTAKGHFACPKDAAGPVPGIIVVHEWWGLNDYAKKRADMLAEMGYAALAVDMYGEGKTASHPKEAGEFAGAVRANLPEARGRFDGAMKALAAQPEVDKERLGAIGYCFGGNIVLQMAVDGVEPLKAVASFHGSLGLQYGDIKPVAAAVLVCHGLADKFVPEAQVTSLKEEMEKRKADFTFIGYEGAKHTFTNPAADAAAKEYGLDIAYDKKADEESWQALKELLERNLPLK